MRIYVSSTYEDLKAHREAVLRAIRRLGHECVAMEEYVAEDVEVAEKCAEDVATCDAYVGLFAWRYGAVTEVELRAAEQHGLPVLAFLIHEMHPWPPPFIDEGEARIRIKALREELKKKLVAFFTTPDDLAASVTAAVSKLAAQREGRDKKPALRNLLPLYLDWMIDCHSTLELRGLRHHGRLHLPLEKMFVALKGDRTHPLERAQARLALERELEAILESGEFSQEEIQEARWYLVASSSVMPSLETRDRPFVLPDELMETLTLGEAYRQHRRLVILGDPGSGKTTLARWLALIMARALKSGPEKNVAVPLHQIDPEVVEGGEESFLLGRAKLPVLVRIAEYAEDRLACKAQGKVPRTLTEFLGSHTWLTAVPTYGNGAPGHTGRIEPEALNGLILEHLEKREALIILDGLDEVPASLERDEILQEVQAFVRRWIWGTFSREDGQVAGAILARDPAAWPGNQLIVTSRIA